jgi:L-alanine-DL-glutamate epimerase-like enolase superfamily enzyme
MKITEVVSHVLRYDLPEELGYSQQYYAARTAHLVEVRTDEGLVGWGECFGPGNVALANKTIVERVIQPLIVGGDPLDREVIWHNVYNLLRDHGQKGMPIQALSGVDIALWDLSAKIAGLPLAKMMGGQFRDRVRLYADTAQSADGLEAGRRLKERMDRGITYLKVDFGIELIRDIAGALSLPLGQTPQQRGRTMHPFTGVEITDKGVELLSDYVGAIRSVIGMEVPLSTDHFGHMGAKSCIKLARAMEKWNLAWMEDMVPWQFGELTKMIKDNTTVPILTGEDIYLKEDFIKLIDMGAVDMIHPDLASSGGILETKKIGDYAMEKGVPMAMHFAGSPFSFMANVHCAASTENFVALEHHSLDVPWWNSLVTPEPEIVDGFAVVPDRPGLGVDANPEVIKEHIEGEYFAPTPEWDDERSWDRLWS